MSNQEKAIEEKPLPIAGRKFLLPNDKCYFVEFSAEQSSPCITSGIFRGWSDDPQLPYRVVPIGFGNPACRNIAGHQVFYSYQAARHFCAGYCHSKAVWWLERFPPETVD